MIPAAEISFPFIFRSLVTSTYVSGTVTYQNPTFILFFQSLGSLIKQTASANLVEEKEVNADSSHHMPTEESAEERDAVQGEFSNHYRIINSLGSGAYGFVRKAVHTPSNTEVRFVFQLLK